MFFFFENFHQISTGNMFNFLDFSSLKAILCLKISTVIEFYPRLNIKIFIEMIRIFPRKTLDVSVTHNFMRKLKTFILIFFQISCPGETKMK